MSRDSRFFLLVYRSNSPVLSNPRFSIRLGREPLRVLNEVAQACYPDLAAIAVLEDFVLCVGHDHPSLSIWSLTSKRYARLRSRYASRQRSQDLDPIRSGDE